MSIIKHITEQVCATCGAEPICDQWNGHTHINGQRFEEREFACGRRVQWIPNFERMGVLHECPKHPAMAATLKLREEDERAFVELAESRGWSEERIASLRSFLKYTRR